MSRYQSPRKNSTKRPVSTTFFSIGSTLVAAAVCGLYYGSGTKKMKRQNQITAFAVVHFFKIYYRRQTHHMCCQVLSCPGRWASGFSVGVVVVVTEICSFAVT